MVGAIRSVIVRGKSNSLIVRFTLSLSSHSPTLALKPECPASEYLPTFRHRSQRPSYQWPPPASASRGMVEALAA